MADNTPALNHESISFQSWLCLTPGIDHESIIFYQVFFCQG